MRGDACGWVGAVVADVPGADPSRFQELFDAHAEPLRRYAQRIVRSREAAEDVVQEVFLRLWRLRDCVELGASVRAYLYVTTRSRALNHVKREQRERRRRELALPRGILADEPALPPDGPAKVESDEIVRAIEEVLAMMPPRQREVATLRLRSQLTAAEIAARLGISPRTVGIHLGRATKVMRAQLPSLVARDPCRRPCAAAVACADASRSSPRDHTEGFPAHDQAVQVGR